MAAPARVGPVVRRRASRQADVKDRTLSTAIGLDGDPTASLEMAFEVAELFGVKASEARGIAAEVGASSCRWRAVATRVGISASEIDRLSSAFDHVDLALARRSVR